jgi:hypothetical protein
VDQKYEEMHDLDKCKYTDGTKVADEEGHIEKIRTLWKLMNNASVNYNDVRFKTKLIELVP